MSPQHLKASALACAVLLSMMAISPLVSASYDNRISVTFSGTIPLDSYGQPQISSRQTLLYLYEASAPTGDAWGTFELREVNLATLEVVVSDVFISDGNIILLDNGAVFVMVGDVEYYGMYWNIADDFRRDTLLKTADGHDDYRLVFSEWIMSKRQIFSYNAQTGKSSMITSSPYNHVSPRISGTTVVYERFDDDWNIYCSDIAGGPEVQVSSFTGDEADPLIDGDTVVFSREVQSGRELYYSDIYSGEPVMLSGQAGSYTLNDGHVLYFDAEESEWVVYCIDTGFFTFLDTLCTNTDEIAVSSRYACVGGDIFKLYDSPSPPIPTTCPPDTTVPPTDTPQPSVTLAPTATPEPANGTDTGDGPSAVSYVAAFIVGALVVAAGWYVSTYYKKERED